MSSIRDNVGPDDTAPDNTEKQLQDALKTLAGGVHPAPDAYSTARGEWLRRERRRRVVLAVLIAVVFALATLIGLWILNEAPSHHGVIFDHAAVVSQVRLVGFT